MTATRARRGLQLAPFIRSASRLLLVPALSVLIGLVAGGIFVLVTMALVPTRPFDPMLPLAAYRALWDGAVGSPNAIVSTFVFATPLLLAALGVALGFKAGLFNIGAQGQFLVGTVAAIAMAGTIQAAPWWADVPAAFRAPAAISLALLAGTAAGALWGFIPGFLKATSGAHEVVTTIMLNNIATAVLSWAVTGPLRLPNSTQPQTARVRDAALPPLFDNGHAGILIALVAVPIIWFLLYRTTKGFEIRAAGANPDAARYGGMRPRRLIVLTMTIAGLLSGLGGACVLLGLGPDAQMTTSFSTTVGFDSITVALLGRSHPVGVLFAALLLGGMRAGSGPMQIDASVPAQLVDVIQMVILLSLVIAMAIQALRRSRAVPGEEEASLQTITRTYGQEGI